MKSNHQQPRKFSYVKALFTPLLLSLTLGGAPDLSALNLPIFSAPVNYACATCDQICAGDFNGDGKPDLVVSSASAQKLAIFTNNGSGLFGTCTNYLTGGIPHSIAVGDFNGDTNLDFLAVTYPNDSVTAWTGYGNGTFAPPKVSGLSVNTWYTGVATGDFNNDGKLDVVVTTFGPQILLGQGDGYFSFLTSYSIGTTYAAATGYFNSDTNLDFVTGNYSSSSVTAFLGSGNGTFPSPTSYSGDNSEYHYAVVAGDFNNDGKCDLATVNYYFGCVSVRTNLGNGTFGPEARYKTPPCPLAMDTTDFNGDGNLDLLTANSSTTASLAILCGKGDGTFAGALTNFPGLSASLANQCIAVADFNGDGRPDIASTCTAANSVSIRLNQTRPELQIQTAGASRLKFIWPDWTGYALECTTNLSDPSAWTAVGGSTGASGGQKVQTNSIVAEQLFYRLKK